MMKTLLTKILKKKHNTKNNIDLGKVFMATEKLFLGTMTKNHFKNQNDWSNFCEELNEKGVSFLNLHLVTKNESIRIFSGGKKLIVEALNEYFKIGTSYTMNSSKNKDINIVICKRLVLDVIYEFKYHHNGDNQNANGLDIMAKIIDYE